MVARFAERQIDSIVLKEQVFGDLTQASRWMRSIMSTNYKPIINSGSDPINSPGIRPH